MRLAGRNRPAGVASDGCPVRSSSPTSGRKSYGVVAGEPGRPSHTSRPPYPRNGIYQPGSQPEVPPPPHLGSRGPAATPSGGYPRLPHRGRFSRFLPRRGPRPDRGDATRSQRRHRPPLVASTDRDRIPTMGALRTRALAIRMRSHNPMRDEHQPSHRGVLLRAETPAKRARRPLRRDNHQGRPSPTQTVVSALQRAF